MLIYNLGESDFTPNFFFLPADSKPEPHSQFEPAPSQPFSQCRNRRSKLLRQLYSETCIAIISAINSSQTAVQALTSGFAVTHAGPEFSDDYHLADSISPFRCCLCGKRPNTSSEEQWYRLRCNLRSLKKTFVFQWNKGSVKWEENVLFRWQKTGERIHP